MSNAHQSLPEELKPALIFTAAARLPGEEGAAGADEERYLVLIKMSYIVPGMVAGQGGGDAEAFPERLSPRPPRRL